MEFGHREVDRRRQLYVSPPLNIYGSFKQPLPDPSLRHSTDIAMHRELEMMRFREEKRLVEIERQRILNELAWKELMLVERELAFQRIAQMESLAYKPLGMPINRGVTLSHPPHGWLVDEQLKHNDNRPLDSSILPRPQELMARDRKPQLQDNKSRMIVLEKTVPELSFTTSHKAELSTVAADDIRPCPPNITKNSEDEWSCALCQVTSTSEKAFEEHLQGKKHKIKEAGLRAQKMNCSRAAPAPLPSKKRKLSVVRETTGSAGSQQENEKPICEQRDTSTCTTEEPELKSMRLRLVKQNMSAEDKVVPKRKFKFWCEMCKVGAFCSQVMDDHVKGKKHIAGIQKLGKGTEAYATVVKLSREKQNHRAQKLT